LVSQAGATEQGRRGAEVSQRLWAALGGEHMTRASGLRLPGASLSGRTEGGSEHFKNRTAKSPQPGRLEADSRGRFISDMRAPRARGGFYKWLRQPSAALLFLDAAGVNGGTLGGRHNGARPRASRNCGWRGRGPEECNRCWAAAVPVVRRLRRTTSRWNTAKIGSGLRWKRSEPTAKRRQRN